MEFGLELCNWESQPLFGDKFGEVPSTSEQRAMSEEAQGLKLRGISICKKGIRRDSGPKQVVKRHMIPQRVDVALETPH